MQNPESVLENETHILLWGFAIETDHLISTRQPDVVKVNKTKRTCRIVDVALPCDHWVKLKENEKKDIYLDFAK